MSNERFLRREQAQFILFSLLKLENKNCGNKKKVDMCALISSNVRCSGARLCLTLAVRTVAEVRLNKSVSRNRCIPVEKTLGRSRVEFYLQVNSTSFSIIFRFLFVCGFI
jgi:hypothetical protein